MRDNKPPPPLLHPTYRKQRDALLTGYDSLDEEDRETVRMAAHDWGFMARTITERRWEIEDDRWGEPKILGA